MKKLLTMFLLLFTLNGCSVKLGHFSTITTKKVDFSKKHIRSSKKYIGKDVTKMYVIFPTRWHPDIDKAVSNVLKSTDTSYMTDATIRYKFWFIPYIYGQFWYEVEGYVWHEIE